MSMAKEDPRSSWAPDPPRPMGPLPLSVDQRILATLERIEVLLTPRVETPPALGPQHQRKHK